MATDKLMKVITGVGSWNEVDISPGSNTVYLGGGYRGFAVCLSYAQELMGIYIFGTTSSGSVSFKAVSAVPSFSISTGDGRITIANSHAGGTQMLFFTYQGNQPHK